MNLVAANVNWRTRLPLAISAVSQRRLQQTGLRKESGRDEARPSTARLSAFAARRKHPDAGNVRRCEHGENTP